MSFKFTIRFSILILKKKRGMKKLIKSENFAGNQNGNISSDDLEESENINYHMNNKNSRKRESQYQSSFGASKGVNFNKSNRESGNETKIDFENLKKMSRLGISEKDKNSHKLIANAFKDEGFSMSGRLTSSQIPWTCRFPHTNRNDMYFEDVNSPSYLKSNDLGASHREGSNNPETMQMVKERTIKEKNRLERLEEIDHWKRNGYHNKKMSSGRIPQQYLKKLDPNSVSGSYGSKEGLSHIYRGKGGKNKGNPGGSFSGAQMNLKNFSSNLKMYNYDSNNHSNLNFSKNKFNLNQRLTSIRGKNGRPETKYYTNGRNNMRNNAEHVMPEIDKKSKIVIIRNENVDTYEI